MKLVQVGTQTVFEQIPVELAQQGVVFTDFHSALEEIPELVEEFFMSSVKYDDDKLAAYHTAYFNSGAVLYIPDNVEIKSQSKVFSTKTAIAMCRLTNIL